MKYNELVQFESVESVVQLKEASNEEKAYKLIDTYVISDHMAEVIDEVIIEQLQFNYPADNKGLLVVGNYGTGKSHLMSVLSTIAEIQGSVSRIKHPRVAEKAKEIEGKFHVLRTELDGIRMSLQEFVFGEIVDYLEELGIDYEMPDVERIRSNKDELMKMMAAFEEVYPNKGFLMVIDEMLDYLGSRKEQELMLDLNFLRAMGEVCRTSRFRFITGIQEMLFDNPRFSFVAEQVNRVKERTEQAVIVREDIEYVVSQRLLKKNEQQKALIREHLEKFIPYYEKLGERMDKYVELFPIHPAYLATFEKVTVAEKRVILKTVSREMKKLLNEDVPDHQPGFISYDSYWPYIVGDKGMKVRPNVKEVMAKTSILMDRIENAFTRPAYRPMAYRIIQALAVFRLTTDNIFSKVGITSEELRDQLFLYADLPEANSEFLRGTIEAVLKAIRQTVSYQYISVNEENGQYYLDLQKDIDVDSLIDEKAETLSDDQLDRYYFEILERVTDRPETTYKTGYRIWPYELKWEERKVTRPGYLFFGAPNERSTAQPERDFYIYMLAPFTKKSFKDEEKPDEVFFQLTTKDEGFYRNMRLYAGAKELAVTAPSGSRNLYDDKARTYLQGLTSWLKKFIATDFKMTYQGKTSTIKEWSLSAPPNATFKEMIDTAANERLNDWFNEKYPDYPYFRRVQTVITRESMRTSYIPEALRNIKHPKTKNGITILEGLVLLDNGKLKVHQSGYAKWVLDVLNSKGEGQVVNASELLDVVEVYNGNEELKKTVEFQLEPELFSVLLAALVFNGDIVLTINNVAYDGMKFDELIKLSPEQIADFTHIKKPSEFPLAALGELLDMFGIGRGYLQNNALDVAVAQLNKESRGKLNEVVTVHHEMKDGIPTWEGPLYTLEKVSEVRSDINELKEFLEHIQIYDTPAKLKNFKYTVENVKEKQGQLELVQSLGALRKKVLELTQEANYLIRAKHQVPPGNEWSRKVDAVLKEVFESLQKTGSVSGERNEFWKLKEEYKTLYLSLHDSARLNATEEGKKNVLLNDPRLVSLKRLSAISILSEDQLQGWETRLHRLKGCWQLTKEQLDHKEICSHCGYMPKEEGSNQQVSLEQLADELEELTENWTNTLFENLSEPEIKNNIPLLGQESRSLIEAFLTNRELEHPVSGLFVEAVKELLQGIEKIAITFEDLEQMMKNGSPLTVEELKGSFNQLLNDKVGRTPAKNIRVLLKGSAKH